MANLRRGEERREGGREKDERARATVITSILTSGRQGSRAAPEWKGQRMPSLGTGDVQ